MSNITETIAEVLRLDELSEVLSPAPWHVSGVDPQHVRDDADEATADAYCSNDAALIAYYRTAAPALAREVQRLQAEVDAALAVLRRYEWAGEVEDEETGYMCPGACAECGGLGGHTAGCEWAACLREAEVECWPGAGAAQRENHPGGAAR